MEEPSGLGWRSRPVYLPQHQRPGSLAVREIGHQHEHQLLEDGVHGRAGRLVGVGAEEDGADPRLRRRGREIASGCVRRCMSGRVHHTLNATGLVRRTVESSEQLSFFLKVVPWAALP